MAWLPPQHKLLCTTVRTRKLSIRRAACRSRKMVTWLQLSSTSMHPRPLSHVCVSLLVSPHKVCCLWPNRTYYV